MTSELMAAVESLGRTLNLDLDPDISAHEFGTKQPARPRPFLGGQTVVQWGEKPVHLTRREGDEWACGCGARWGIDEDPPAGHHGP